MYLITLISTTSRLPNPSVQSPDQAAVGGDVGDKMDYRRNGLQLVAFLLHEILKPITPGKCVCGLP